MNELSSDTYSSWNPLNYSLAEVQKFVLALVVSAIAIAAYFIAIPTGFESAFQTLIGEVFAVIAAFAAKNVTYDDASKALYTALGGAIALSQFFVTVDPNTLETILAIASQVILVGAVFFKSNAPALA